MNNNKPKTIQIYLPKGNPRGLRIAEMTTNIVRLIEIPRVYIDDFFMMPEANQVGLYFLIGDIDSSEKPKLYIGQTGELKRRLGQHVTKDFWTRAFVMLSTNNSMTQTHTLYMEHKAIALATKVGRYDIQNGNTGNKPYTTAPLQADCEDLFDTLDTLLSTLGQPVFETFNFCNSDRDEAIYINNAPNNFDRKIDSNIQVQSTVLSLNKNTEGSSMLFYCKVKGGFAQGYYSNDGFILLAGSCIRRETKKTMGKKAFEKHKQMSDQKKLEDYDDLFYKLAEDHFFESLNIASTLVTGRGTDGRFMWKSEKGESLD